MEAAILINKVIKFPLRTSLIFLTSFYLSTTVFAQQKSSAITQSFETRDLLNFDTYTANVKALISDASDLSKQNLSYQYASSDPKNGGMDCSGTIYYLLKKAGIKEPPRQANEMYVWVEQKGNLYTLSDKKMENSVLKNLKAGDLLFWTGTYAVKRVPPITHVMLYLGVDKNQRPLMFGSSDGRTYQNKKMWGVSVFDFKSPERSSGQIAGFGCIPSLTCETQAATS